MIVVLVMTGLTFVLWGASRVACNYSRTVYHPPRPMPLETRVKTAKGTAVEFELQLARGDLETASRLASGAALEHTEALERACQASPETCTAAREEARAAKLAAVADVARRAEEAVVFNVTTYSGADESVHHLEVRRGRSGWRVVDRGDGAWTKSPEP